MWTSRRSWIFLEALSATHEARQVIYERRMATCDLRLATRDSRLAADDLRQTTLFPVLYLLCFSARCRMNAALKRYSFCPTGHLFKIKDEGRWMISCFGNLHLQRRIS